MTTPTTTLEAIRDNMIRIVEGLSPTLASDVSFEVSRGEEDFRSWAEQNASSAFRRFSLRRASEGGPPEVSNCDVEHRIAELELVMAYPRQWGRYGGDNERDAEDFIVADRERINGQSGIGHANSGGYTSGQHSSVMQAPDIEEGRAVLFSRLIFEVTFYRSVSS